MAFSERELLWVATNAETQAWCRARYGECLVLDETLTKNAYRDINQFAHTIALTLGYQETNSRTRFFLESHFIDIRTLFMRLLKCFLVLEKVVEWWDIKEIGLLEDRSSLIAIVLAHWPNASKKFSVTFAPALRIRPTVKLLDPKKTAYAFLSRLSNLKTICRFGGTRQKKLLVASGSLTHLSPLLNELRKTIDVMFFENQFNLEKYAYCRSRDMGFVTLPVRKKEHPFQKNSLSQRGGVVYQGTDLSLLCDAAFSQFHEIGFLNHDFDEKQLFHLFTKFRPDGLLLDEDLVLRRALLIAALERSVPTFVISHGIPTIWKEDEIPTPTCRSGMILVNSQFEKIANESAFGYDASKVFVTGTPRFDRISELKRTAAAKSVNSIPKTILFCGTIMLPYDFDRLSAISVSMGQRNLAQDFMTTYLADVVWAIASRKDVCVKIKPHYAEEKLWELALRSLENNARHQVLSHRLDILTLITLSDLVLTAPSSLICEAILLNKPVIVLDYESDGMSDPYKKSGVARVVKNREELRIAVEDYLFDPASLTALARQRQSHGDYFTGLNDGGNVGRAVDLIQRGMAKS